MAERDFASLWFKVRALYVSINFVLAAGPTSHTGARAPTQAARTSAEVLVREGRRRLPHIASQGTACHLAEQRTGREQMWANASSNALPAQSTILPVHQGSIGHGRWIPGGNMYNVAPMYSSPLSSRGFGQADTPSARGHPSDTREGFSNEDRVDRADRAAMWCGTHDRTMFSPCIVHCLESC